MALLTLEEATPPEKISGIYPYHIKSLDLESHHLESIVPEGIYRIIKEKPRKFLAIGSNLLGCPLDLYYQYYSSDKGHVLPGGWIRPQRR